MGIVLCPQTLKEFYTYIRAREKKFQQNEKEEKLNELRRRNISLEGKRLKLDKEA